MSLRPDHEKEANLVIIHSSLRNADKWLLNKRKIILCKNKHLVTYRTHRANDIESDAITSPVITFSLGCKVRQMVTLALYKVALVTLINTTEKSVNASTHPSQI